MYIHVGICKILKWGVCIIFLNPGRHTIKDLISLVTLFLGIDCIWQYVIIIWWSDAQFHKKLFLWGDTAQRELNFNPIGGRTYVCSHLPVKTVTLAVADQYIAFFLSECPLSLNSVPSSFVSKHIADSDWKSWEKCGYRMQDAGPVCKLPRPFWASTICYDEILCFWDKNKIKKIPG